MSGKSSKSAKKEYDENGLTAENFDEFYEAVELLYIRDNISGRLKFLDAWPVAARFILGETLIGYDHDGTPDRKYRAALEEQAEDRRYALFEVLRTLEKKSVDKNTLVAEYVESVLKEFGSEIGRLIYTPKIVGRFDNYPTPESEDPPPPEDQEAKKALQEAKTLKTKKPIGVKRSFNPEDKAKGDPLSDAPPPEQPAPAKQEEIKEAPQEEVRAKPEPEANPSEEKPVQAQESQPKPEPETPEMRFRTAVPKADAERKAVPKRDPRVIAAPEAPRGSMIHTPPAVDPAPPKAPEEKPQEKKKLIGGLPVHEPGKRPNLSRQVINMLSKKLDERKKNPPPPKQEKPSAPPVLDTKPKKKTSIVKPAAAKTPEIEVIPAQKKGPLPGKTAKPKKKSKDD